MIGLGFLIPVLIIGGIVYLIVRRRDGNGGITAYESLITYFYLVTAASVITMAVGLGYLSYVLFREVYGYGEIANDVTTGVTLLATGMVICLLHVLGRRAVEKQEDKTTKTLRRVFLFLMLGIFSIAGLVSLPLAVNSSLHYYIADSSSHDTPERELASALIAVPFWLYYLFRVLREMRTEKRKTEVEPQRHA
jgi:cytochrome bd-type quinol oxidase subunit 2